MEAIFNAHSDGQRLTFYNTDDFAIYLAETKDEDLIISVKPKANAAEKLRMYAFYHGPVMHCAMMGYTAAGYHGIDKVKAEYLLRAEFGKDFIQKPDGTYQVIMLDRSSMSKNRFLKYLQDCLLFIEETLKMQVPDSEEWRMKQFTKRNFKKA